MIKAVEAIITVLLLFGGGALLQKLGWVNDSVMRFISKFVVQFSVPCMMVWNLTNMFDQQQLFEMLPLVPLPIVMMLLLYGASWLVCMLFHVAKDRRGTFVLMSVISNTLFIGLPVSMIVYGPDSMPGVTVSFLASTVICWTIGVGGLDHDARFRLSNGEVVRVGLGRRIVKIVSTPPMIALFIGVVMALLGVRMPSALNNALSYIGSTTTPLSMLYIGMFLATIPLRELIPSRDSWLVYMCRFVLAPILMYIVVWIARICGVAVDGFTSDVLLVQMAMPVMAQAVILASDFGGDGPFAAKTTATSNLLFLVAFPVLLLILGS